MTAYIATHTSTPRPELLEATTPGGHVWTALALFRVDTHTLARNLDTGANYPVLLDRENLATVEVGCFHCDTPYTPDVTGTRCPGQPLH